MNHSMINSVVSMNSLQQKLDIIANNMANINTVGFKRREATFQDVLTTVAEQSDSFRQEGRRSPLGLPQGWGSRISQVQIDMNQGTLQETNNPLDVAVEGDALFEVGINPLDDDGNTAATTAWTRNGSFRLSMQPGDTENAYLTTEQGHWIRGVNNEAIRIPKGYNVVIDAQGNVKAHNQANANAQPLDVGSLKLVRVIRPQSLESIGDHLFIVPDDVNNENGEIIQPVNFDNNGNSIVSVRQGFLEQSNVVLSDEMTQLLTVQRAYQLTSRALVSADTMMNLTNNLRG